MTASPTAAATESSAAPADADLESARRVLGLEVEGLQALSRALDGRFIAALDLLSGIDGRIVVTGMGKSGHIGNKIAATLASTGSSAFFVHPAEASHGDLGMITRDDAVIALSNSGETAELSDVIGYTRRYSIPLVAITSRGDSTLAEASDVALVLPKVAEACSLGLAPTTSTTMTLALGDAIAVALLERRGFTAADFKVFHPGGSLGQALIRVRDLMHPADTLPLVGAEAPMSQAILEMSSKGFGCVGIVDGDKRLTGVITDGDLRRHMGDGLISAKAGAIMTAAPKTTRPGLLAGEALAKMNETKITSLFVVDDDGRPVGLLHVHDCLRAGVL